MPHLIKLDHHRPAFRLGLVRVGGGELLQPSLDRRCRDTEQLGGAVHRQAADIQQDRGGLHGQRLAAGGRVGEVQATGLAPIPLLGAHQPIFDVLLTATTLALQTHDPPPAECARRGR